MRWILVALVLLNGVYLGWEYWKRNASAPLDGAVVTPDASENAQSLVLLTERLPPSDSSEPPPALVSKSPAPAPVAVPATTSPQPEKAPSANARDLVCYSLGPFSKRAWAEEVSLQLSLEQIGNRLQEIGPEKNARYWVVLPSQPSREKAQRLLRELQARKIDSYLISSGELNNAISLGLFSREVLANAVRDKVREAGYPAEIHLKDPAESQIWVRLQPGQPLEKVEKLIKSPLARESGIKISNTPCEMFAQAR